MSCPKCDWAGWRSARFEYESGISKKSSTTIMGGVGDGPGDEAIPMGGMGTSNGTQQTETSRKAAPPQKSVAKTPAFPAYDPETTQKMTSGIGALAVALIGPFFGLGWGVFIIFFAVFAYMVVTIDHKAKKEAEERHKREVEIAKYECEQNYIRAMERYERTRMCTQCGIFYIEGEGVVPNPGEAS